jgi:DNA-binding transcriptional ArsR family regulator
MSDTPFQIEEIFTIKDLDTLKVVADPLRIRILEFFSDENPHTVKQISTALEIAPNKLYYHVNMLEEYGLLRVVDTRIVSGIIEKLYMVVAHTIQVDRNLLSPSGSSVNNEALTLMVEAMLDETKRSIFESARAGLIDTSEEGDVRDRLIMGSMTGRLRAEDAHEFIQRFNALVKEFADRDDPSGKPYRLSFTIFPSVDHPDPNED